MAIQSGVGTLERRTVVAVINPHPNGKNGNGQGDFAEITGAIEHVRTKHGFPLLNTLEFQLGGNGVGYMGKLPKGNNRVVYVGEAYGKKGVYDVDILKIPWASDYPELIGVKIKDAVGRYFRVPDGADNFHIMA